MRNDAKIFVPFADFDAYKQASGWSYYHGQNKLYYDGSVGLVYGGVDANNNAVTATNDIVNWRIGTGTTVAGNALTSEFNSTFLGIPQYHEYDPDLNNGNGSNWHRVTVIGVNAFRENTRIEKVSIPESVSVIGDYAFYGCTNIKFVICNKKIASNESFQDAVPTISANTFKNMSPDRIFVVPDSISRSKYIQKQYWQDYASMIITYDEYEAMSSGSGFTHFVISNTTANRVNISLTIIKHDTEPMTVIYGDGTSGILTNTEPHTTLTITHDYDPKQDGNYTLSIIARGPWNIPSNLPLMGNTSKNSYVVEAHFDNQFVGYNSEGNRDTTLTIGSNNKTLFSGCTNMVALTLPSTVGAVADGLLETCNKLQTLTIPFTGIKQRLSNISDGCFGLAFSQTAVAGTEAITQKFTDSSSITRYIPTSLTHVTVLTESAIEGNSNGIPYGAFSGCKNIESITIPSAGVVSIYNYAFEGCTNLTSVNLPNTILNIDPHAFEGCENLHLTNLPSSLTGIADSAFKGCSNITVSSLPTNVAFINNAAFQGCTNLAISALPVAVSYIGPHAFEGCENITLSVLPTLTDGLQEYTFSGCRKVTFSTLPEGMTSIPSHLFNECEHVTFSTLPSTVTSIGDYGFAGCYNQADNTGVTFATLPSGLTTLGNHAFEGCKGITLTSIANISSIGEYTFSDCTNIVLSEIPVWGSIPAGCFKNCENIIITTLQFTQGAVITIGAYAFYNCNKMNISTLPNSLTINEYAFYNCEEITISSLPIMNAIKEYTFYNCRKITAGNISGNVKNIGSKAFGNCTSISEISIGNIASVSQINTIANDAFDGTNLRQIVLYVSDTAGYEQKVSPPWPAGIDVGWGAKTNSPTVSIYASKASSSAWSSGELDNYLVMKPCLVSSDGTITEQGSYDASTTTHFAIGGWKSSVTASQLSTIGSVIVPTQYTYNGRSYDIVAISDNAFKDSPAVGTVIAFVAESVIKKIGNYAFGYTNSTNNGCHVTFLPNTVEIIGDHAFENNVATAIFSFPSSLTSIGSYAFRNCINVTASTLPSTIKEVKAHAFDGCTSITTLHMESCTQIEDIDISYTGTNPTSITEVDLPISSSNMKTFRTANIKHTIICKFRIHATSADYTIFSTENYGTNATGYSVYVKGGTKLFVNHTLVYSKLEANTDYIVALWCIPSDTVSLRSGIFMINDREYSRFTFGYNHTVVSSTTYGTYSFMLGTANISKIAYYSRIIEDYESIWNTWATGGTAKMYTLPDTTYRDRSVYISANVVVPVQTSMDGDRFNSLSWREVMAVAREGYMAPLQTSGSLLSGSSHAANDAKLVLDRYVPIISSGGSLPDGALLVVASDADNFNPATQIHIDDVHTIPNLTVGTYVQLQTHELIQAGEGKSVPMRYNESSRVYGQWKSMDASASDEDVEALKAVKQNQIFECLGFGVDVNEELGTSPITIGMHYLMPDKSALYTASHNFHSTYSTKVEGILSRDEAGTVQATNNGTTISVGELQDSDPKETDPSGEQFTRVWYKAVDISCISAIREYSGSTTKKGYYFSSTAGTNYTNMQFNHKFSGDIFYYDGYYHDKSTSTSDAGRLHVISSDSANVGADEILLSSVRSKDNIVAGDYVKPHIPVPTDALLIDARHGYCLRDESSECFAMTAGVKIGIPAHRNMTISVTYYSSYNLTGWRDCIARRNGNSDHYNALPDDLKYITEDVLKDTNIGGLHKMINQTSDKLFLYSLTEAGMYSTTDPYSKEGNVYHWFAYPLNTAQKYTYPPTYNGNGGRSTVRKKIVVGTASDAFDYWWVRTPWYSSAVGTNVIELYLSISNLGVRTGGTYSSSSQKVGVCFGLSLRAQEKPRIYCADINLLKSLSGNTIPVSCASALTPLSPITHVFGFNLNDITSTYNVIDMRYGISAAGGSHCGYIIKVESGLLKIVYGSTSQTLLTFSSDNIDAGDKINLVIRQDALSEGAAATVSVFVAHTKVRDVTITLANTTSYIRKYSADAKSPTIDTSHVEFDTIEFIQKKLTDAELIKLYNCRFLSLTA